MSRLLVVLATLAACGDNAAGPGPDGSPDAGDLLSRLRALPGVTATESPTGEADYHYFVLEFTQPVDHAAPGGQTFQQEVSLLYRDTAAPMIVHTSGYWDYYLDNPVELTRLLGANQISIEHRYFGTSRPVPTDWGKLTIEQMAGDEHAIIAALHGIFSGAFVTTGASKGGMTATYHRRFFPDDVAGSVPYVAPLSFGAPDTRYDAFLDTVGTQPCRDAVRAVAVEMLAHRRAAMTSRAAAQTAHVYTRVPLDVAVEGSIVGLEWSFWQYSGIDHCADVPAVTATDDALFAFLDDIAPVGDNDDPSCAQFEAYYYQAYAQLGYPAGGAAYLDAYEQYTDADYLGILPTAPPAYDGGTAMHDVDSYIQTSGAHLMFVYGQWDPWTGGAYALGAATDAAKYVQAEGTHGSHLTQLAAADRDAAFTRLGSWTGVTPASAKMTQRAAPREPRVPTALRRALRARR
jgi:hypothetical protein